MRRGLPRQQVACKYIPRYTSNYIAAHCVLRLYILTTIILCTLSVNIYFIPRDKPCTVAEGCPKRCRREGNRTGKKKNITGKNNLSPPFTLCTRDVTDFMYIFHTVRPRVDAKDAKDDVSSAVIVHHAYYYMYTQLSNALNTMT